MYTVGLYTLGCKVSLYETEAIAEEFARSGFEIRSFDEVCDVYVINTCTVTAESDAKSRKYIRRAIRKNPDAAVIVVGCYSQRAPQEVAAIDGVSAVFGTQDKMRAVEVARKVQSAECRVQSSVGTDVPGGPGVQSSVGDGASTSRNCASTSRKDSRIFVSPLDGAKFEPMCVKRAPRTRAYVKIEDGCECKCTYCAISGARGPVRSKRPEDVIAEVEGLYKNGTREIVLTGIETGSYGADFDKKYDLADLLTELDKRGRCERIRLGSMAPELLSERFISRVGNLKILVPHIHISMQSGSDNVLRGMKRRYNRKMALENIARIREYKPDTMFTADLMVGFPGESEEDFLDTVRFVREARLLDAHVFAYSKREGTPAATYENQIDESTKRERSARLIAEKNAVRDEVLTEVVASCKVLSCIAETRDKCGIYTAHSDSYIEVRFEGHAGLSGDVVSIIPEYHKDGVIYGKLT